MTKNILIVGTSHTAGSCVDPNDNMMPKNADGFSTLDGKEYFKAGTKERRSFICCIPAGRYAFFF